MKTAVIYGATTTGQRVYDEIKNKYRVEYFVDGNPEVIGSEVNGIRVEKREEIFRTNPDIVVMGILTGYEDAAAYLIQNGLAEDKIITKFVDLNSRARRDCLEKIAIIFEEKKVAGAVAELGVYRGDFAKVINEVFPDRKLYLFDTFEGFPEQDMAYELQNSLLLNKVGKLVNTSVDYVLGRMPHRGQCVVRKGYFPDTAAGLENEGFAFVNIDVDLYKPILAGLEYFWPRMAENGYIFVHDYFSFSYAGAKKAIDEFSAKHKIGFTPIGDTLSVAFVKSRNR